MVSAGRVAKVTDAAGGNLLVGRPLGAVVRDHLFSGGPNAWPSTLDFTGVVQATESCVDEVFAPLAREWGLDRVKKIALTGMAPVVKDAVDYVFRLLENPPPAPSPDSLPGILQRSRLRRA